MTPPAATHSAAAQSPVALTAPSRARSIGQTHPRTRDRAVSALRPAPYRLVLVAGMVAVAATLALMTDAPPGDAVDASFVRMMRVMAMIKAVLVAIAAAVLWWRFARPITALFATGYLLGAWFMVAATVLIWQLSSIGAAAVVFHTGELSLLFLAWRDTRSV